jgi:hypothetical protein
MEIDCQGLQTVLTVSLALSLFATALAVYVVIELRKQTIQMRRINDENERFIESIAISEGNYSIEEGENGEMAIVPDVPWRKRGKR